MDFNARAKTWDTDYREKRARLIAREIEKATAGKTYHKSLEFGCGTGLVSLNLHHLLREMTLVDSSREMIRVVKKKIEDRGIHNMSAHAMDIIKEDKLAGRYDLIYMSMALHHVTDTEALLRTLFAHLEEDGCLCIVDLTEDDGSFHQSEKDFEGHNGFNPDKLAGLLETIGFTDPVSKSIFSDTRESAGGDVPYSLFLMTAKKKG